MEDALKWKTHLGSEMEDVEAVRSSMEDDTVAPSPLCCSKKEDVEAVSQYAVMQYYAPKARTIKGGHGIFDVWNPSLNTSSDFSLTQIWVVAGSGSNVNTMKAGWKKYPARTGDNQTHFFIYWIADQKQTEEEMVECGLSPKMIADQKCRAQAKRGGWNKRYPWYLDEFFDQLAQAKRGDWNELCNSGCEL
ncbi:hypothetical protein Droror1_Dr00003030 [Drosera rotundifolia]